MLFINISNLVISRGETAQFSEMVQLRAYPTLSRETRSCTGNYSEIYQILIRLFSTSLSFI